MRNKIPGTTAFLVAWNVNPHHSCYHCSWSWSLVWRFKTADQGSATYRWVIDCGNHCASLRHFTLQLLSESWPVRKILVREIMMWESWTSRVTIPAVGFHANVRKTSSTLQLIPIANLGETSTAAAETFSEDQREIDEKIFSYTISTASEGKLTTKLHIGKHR